MIDPNRKRMSIAGIVVSGAALVALALGENYTEKAVIPVPGDRPTIGFGTANGVKMGDTITPPKALARALQDIQKFEGAIKKCVKVPLHQYEYDAYLELTYNIGEGAFCRKADKNRKKLDGTPDPEPDRLIDLINAERYTEACQRILQFDKFKGKPLRGLTLRRQRESAKCMGQSE